MTNEGSTWRRWGGKYALGFVSLAFVSAAVARTYYVGPDLNWDLLNYHQFMGFSLSESRVRQDLAPVGVQSFLNPYWNLLSYWVITSFDSPVGSQILLLFQILPAAIVLLIIREIDLSVVGYFPSPGAVLAFCICLLSPVWWSEFGTSFFSSSTATFVLLSLYLAIFATGERPRHTALMAWFMSGFLLALSCQLKLTNVVFGPGVVLIVGLVALHKNGRPWLPIAAAFAAGSFIGLMALANWNHFLYARWGSPIFPFLNNVFQSEFAAQEYFRDGRWKFDSVWEFILFVLHAGNGTKKTLEIEFTDLRLPIFMFSALASVLAFSIRQAGRPGVGINPEGAFQCLFFFTFFLSGLAAWAVVFAYHRYLIPIEILFGVAIWIVLAFALGSRISVLVLGLLLVVQLTQFEVPNWGKGDHRGEWGSGRFSVEVPEKYSSSPAFYLVSGFPTGYVMSFFHPDSRIARPDFSSPINDRIEKALRARGDLPVRFFSFSSDMNDLRKRAMAFIGSGLNDIEVSCDSFSSVVHDFTVCEMED